MKNTKTTTQTTAPGAEIITAENVQHIAERVAVKLLKAIYQASGHDTMRRLYGGLIADLTANKFSPTAALTDGYDIAQTACAFLCAHMGKRLDAPAEDGTTDKKGNPTTVLRACFRACRSYIYQQAQRHYKCMYIDDLDGNMLQVPFEWDTPTVADYTTVVETVRALNLTAKQSQILNCRLRGKGVRETARAIGLHEKTVREHLQAIARKYTAYTTPQR